MNPRTPLIPAAPQLRVSSTEFSPQWPGSRTRVLCAALSIACLLFASALAAKQKAPATKTVSGIVVDKAEKAIGGAEVSIKDLQTGKTMAIYAEEDGRYQFSGLDPHHDYTVQAKFKGAASETRQVSSIDSRSKLVINLTISPPGS